MARGLLGADIVKVVECCYDVDRPASEWLMNVLDASDPQLDQGCGTHAYFVDLSAADRIEASGFVTSNAELAAQILSFEKWAAVAPAWFQRAIHQSFPAGFAREHLRKSQWAPTVEQTAALMQLADAFGVNGVDSAGRGAVLAAFVPHGHARRGHPNKRVWARVAAHLATGARLVQRLSALPAREEAEAVLSPSGRVEHAVGGAREAPAREALRSMVRRIDRARSRRQREDAEEATVLWEAMVAGRWSLVDHFDRDGRRFVLARPNEPITNPLESLTERERQVLGLIANGHSNKLVGYELGLSASTVSTLLSRARHKLGATDRVSLVRTYLQHRWGLGR